MDFHAKMAHVEIGGAHGMSIPSIAQLLDQNLISPQQALSAQNIGALVRPFTLQTLGKKPPSPLKLPSLRGSGRTARREPRPGAALSPSLPEIGPGGDTESNRSVSEASSSGAARQQGRPGGRAGATSLPMLAPANTPQQQALRGLKRNTAALRRRGSNDSSCGGGPSDAPSVQGLEEMVAGSDDGRAGTASRSREPGSPDSDRLTVRVSDGGTRARAHPRDNQRNQRKRAISPGSARPAPHNRAPPAGPARQGSWTRRDSSPTGFHSKPQRIRALNGAYGLARPDARRQGGVGRQQGGVGRQQGAGRPAVPTPQRSSGRLPRNTGVVGVVRVVPREGLRRQDVPPAAPSQARADRLQLAADRRAGGPGRPVANPALRAGGRGV